MAKISRYIIILGGASRLAPPMKRWIPKNTTIATESGRLNLF